MEDRRKHRRVEVEYCVNLRHPLLGVLTATVNNLSVGGLAMTLDDDITCFVMQEFDIEVQGDGWQSQTPTLPVQVTRVSGRDIALRFLVVNSASMADKIEQGEIQVQPEPKQKNRQMTLRRVLNCSPASRKNSERSAAR